MDRSPDFNFPPWSRRMACAAMLAVGPVLTASGAPAGAQTITFGNASAGMLPESFDTGRTGEGDGGKWEVIEDASAAGGKVLAQLSADRADYRYLMAIYRPLTAADVEISARFKPVAGRIDQAGGVVVRLIDANNYYVARANALEDNVRFYRVANGRRQQLATADAKVTSGAWHVLTLRAEGGRFTVLFNGKVMHNTTDRTAVPRPGSGRVGVWTKADSVTHFDRIEITTLK